MNNNQRMGLVMSIFNLIFANKHLPLQSFAQIPKPQGFEGVVTAWNPRPFVNGTVRGIDVDINDDGRILQLRFMEQNPNKADGAGNLKQTAIRARNGEQIMWVIDRKAQFNAFLGSVQNGQWVPSQDRAAVPVQNTSIPQPQSVPNIPAGTGVPEYVVNTLTPEQNAEADELAMMAMDGGFVAEYEDDIIEEFRNGQLDDPYQ